MGNLIAGYFKKDSSYISVSSILRILKYDLEKSRTILFQVIIRNFETQFRQQITGTNWFLHPLAALLPFSYGKRLGFITSILQLVSREVRPLIQAPLKIHFFTPSALFTINSTKGGPDLSASEHVSQFEILALPKSYSHKFGLSRLIGPPVKVIGSL